MPHERRVSKRLELFRLEDWGRKVKMERNVLNKAEEVFPDLPIPGTFSETFWKPDRGSTELSQQADGSKVRPELARTVAIARTCKAIPPRSFLL
jgi:hypothetical protein